MAILGFKSAKADIESVGIINVANQYWNLPPAELVEHSLRDGSGVLSDTGALVVKTGDFTGRAPKDRFIVIDDTTRDKVDWGDVNMPFEPAHFDALHQKVTSYLEGKDVYVRDAYACADGDYRLNIRAITEYSWSNLFCNNLFLRPTKEEVENQESEWTIIAAPGFHANPEIDHTRQHNFAIINFTKKMILIGGTGYTGEMKKGIFSVLNFVLPTERNVLSMHCSANVGEDGETAIFFGLSGTGKTTLSADPNRGLIGDDEHGWSSNSIFNFEGGCYAKCINLSAEGEPEIYNAIKFGALLENIKFHDDSRTVDYVDITITENTRVAYPIDHIANAVEPSTGSTPKNIFFLTCDAFGVLPPISKLTRGQAMYHFISGYTAKVAGTEAGITEPQTTFSACFGAPFLPLHPTKYADMLGQKMKEENVNVWLVNTGWTGGPYGVGSRIKLKYTRAMITAVLDGSIRTARLEKDPIFGLQVPQQCTNVPTEVLNPRNTWKDGDAFDRKANALAVAFNNNFDKYASEATGEILEAAPKALSKV